MNRNIARSKPQDCFATYNFARSQKQQGLVTEEKKKKISKKP